MADKSILSGVIPNGACYFDRINNHLTLTNDDLTEALVMPEPAGGGDHGCDGGFSVPSEYSSAPLLVIRGIIDGTAANNLAFGVQFKNLADEDAFDAVFAAEDLATNGIGSRSDEEIYEEIITLSTPTFAANQWASFRFFWDDSVASPFTGQFLLLDLLFRYTPSP